MTIATFNSRTQPWFRLVPEDWYLAWLRTIWPTLRDPLLFVATDEPDAILPLFREFEAVSATFGAAAQALPDHVCDFEILRRADYLAICNSSFSRMAAILAPSTQRCFLPSFQTRSSSRMNHGSIPASGRDSPRLRAPAGWIRRPRAATSAGPIPTAARRSCPVGDASTRPTIYFDVSDLLLYLRNHTTLSGIQRVQCEILRNLLDVPPAGTDPLRRPGRCRAASA